MFIHAELSSPEKPAGVRMLHQVETDQTLREGPPGSGTAWTPVRIPPSQSEGFAWPMNPSGCTKKKKTYTVII